MKTFLKILSIALIFIATASCVSTRNTIKNIDNSAPDPILTSKNTFVITEYATDKKYGYDPDYPINIFYRSTENDSINPKRFLDALAGPGGESLQYKILENCCPFPTQRSTIGAGFLTVYEITWAGNPSPRKLYFNIYEKGKIMVPVGLSVKKEN